MGILMGIWGFLYQIPHLFIEIYFFFFFNKYLGENKKSLSKILITPIKLILKILDIVRI